MEQDTHNPPVEVEFVDSPDGVLFTYANHAEVGHTATDIRILFSEILGIISERLTFQRRVHVTLPWLQAKLLARLLTSVVEAYERANGPIQMPKPFDMPASPTVKE